MSDEPIESIESGETPSDPTPDGAEDTAQPSLDEGLPEGWSDHPAVRAKLTALAEKEKELAAAGVNLDLLSRVTNTPEFDTYLALLEQGRLGEVTALMERQAPQGAGSLEDEDEDEDETPAWAKQLSGRLSEVEKLVTADRRTRVRTEVADFRERNKVTDVEAKAMYPKVRAGMSLDDALRSVRAPSLEQENENLRREVARFRGNNKREGTVEGGDMPPNESGGAVSDGRKMSMEEAIAGALAKHGHS